MFKKFKQLQRAGQPYDGPAAYSDDYQLVPRPGYYALDATGKVMLPDVPLVCVDDAGGDPWNPACHYEFAGPKDMPQRVGYVVPEEEKWPALSEVGREGGIVVELESLAEGHTTTEVAS